MIKTLKPIYARPEYYEPLAEAMTQQLYDLIFRPIFDILGTKTPHRINSAADIRDALRAGRIYWENGYFYGQFNAIVGRALRALGASFSAARKAYRLDIGQIPMDMRTDIIIGKGHNQAKTDAILRHLDEIGKTAIVLGSGEHAAAMIDGLNLQVIKTFKVLPESIQIPYELNESRQAAITEAYTTNLDLYINGWKDEQIIRLREKTQQNAALGYRADRLASIVKSEYGVSKSKAAFLARQETSLFVSRYREERYTDAGVRSYIWSTSHDERVRPGHKDLQGRIFHWDSPPIVDPATGRMANPGEDFNCRCLALPVINLGGA